MVDVAISSLTQIKKELSIVAAKSAKKNEPIIKAMNTAKLYSGKDSNDDDIFPEYTETTIELKKLAGQPFNRVTLNDIGRFYRDFFVNAEEGDYEIDSKNPKRNKLAKKYGEDIFGNTEKDEETINKEYILPDLIEYCIENIRI